MDNILIKFENLKGKNPLKAIHLIKTAIDKDPGNFSYLEALGVHLCKSGEDREGLKYLNRAENISELGPSSTFILALSFMKTDQYYQAIKYFRKVNAIYPEAYYNASLCYIRLNQIEKAILEVKSLLKGNTLNKEALRLLIDIYTFSDETQKVKIELENYKNKYGVDSYYHYLLGSEAFRSANYLESVYHLSKIDDKEIDKNQYYEKYGIALSKIKNYNKAYEVFEEVINTGSPHDIVIFEFVGILDKLEKYQEIIDVLNKFESTVLDKKDLKNLRAKAYYKLNLE